MKKLLFYSLVFIGLGFTTEIFFTAISDFIEDANNGSVNWQLKGFTYPWMAFIYGAIPFLFAKGFPLIQNQSMMVRLLIYLFFIYAIEFTAGGLLEMTIGVCPWKYSTGWHIMGWIRLDYAPFWLLFGGILEFVWTFLENHWRA